MGWFITRNWFTWLWRLRSKIFSWNGQAGDTRELMVCEWKSFSHVWLLETTWTAASQAPLSMEFSRQKYWSGLSFSCPGDLPNPWIKPRSPTLQQILYHLSCKGSLRMLTVSVQFSYSVMSDSLRLHGQHHTRPPCPSPTPRVYSNSCPLSWWCHPNISSSVGPSPPTDCIVLIDSKGLRTIKATGAISSPQTNRLKAPKRHFFRLILKAGKRSVSQLISSFCLGFLFCPVQLIEWGPLTSGRKICFF